jgi:hypothetical protein
VIEVSRASDVLDAALELDFRYGFENSLRQLPTERLVYFLIEAIAQFDRFWMVEEARNRVADRM